MPPLREEEEAKESSGIVPCEFAQPWLLEPGSQSSLGQRSVEPRAASQYPHRTPYSPVFLFLIKEGDAFLVVFVVCSFCLGVGEAPQGLMWMDVEIHG